MNNSLIQSILSPDPDSRGWAARVASAAPVVADWSNEQVHQLLTSVVAGYENKSPAESNIFSSVLIPVIQKLIRRNAQSLAKSPPDELWPTRQLHGAVQWYRAIEPDHELRNHLLHWLVSGGTINELDAWAELLCENPPLHRPGIAWAFAPLLSPDFAVPPQTLADVLSKLLRRATGFPQIASAIFDLANHFFRTDRLNEHPAADRADALTELLGQLAGQLGKVEDGDVPPGLDPNQVNHLVADSVATIVALCDTVALLEHEPAIGKLHQVLSLRHRRVQTEAAAALARLNDPLGKQALIGLAEEPVVRLRVLAYAEELGLTNMISLEYQGEIATAESHLAMWLAEPTQMGMAPAEMELLDSREMLWPSYEHPLQCFLFRYTYGSGNRVFRNIGISGPLTHAFAADIQHLSLDDMYALFAGWQTVHQEIFQMSVEQAERSFGNELRRLSSILRDEAVAEVEVQTVGNFFGQVALVASATRDAEAGTLIVDSNSATWIAAGNPQAPIDASLAYTLWRGRHLLASFNESDATG